MEALRVGGTLANHSKSVISVFLAPRHALFSPRLLHWNHYVTNKLSEVSYTMYL